MVSGLHRDIKPNGKECLGTTRRMERLRHQPGKGSPIAWENERTAACERIQLPDKTLRFPLSNHATIISIPQAVMCSDREGLLLCSLHGNGTAAKTQQWAARWRKEGGERHWDKLGEEELWMHTRCKHYVQMYQRDERDVQLSFYCNRRSLMQDRAFLLCALNLSPYDIFPKYDNRLTSCISSYPARPPPYTWELEPQRSGWLMGWPVRLTLGSVPSVIRRRM